MSCERLVCASCAGPVSEGRCPVCRTARDHVHVERSSPATVAVMVALFLVALALLAVRLHA
ncbi:MAG: hypothetical protein ACTHQ3_07705 [Motilibacteraceae bacterium]